MELYKTLVLRKIRKLRTGKPEADNDKFRTRSHTVMHTCSRADGGAGISYRKNITPPLAVRLYPRIIVPSGSKMLRIVLYSLN